MTLPLGTVPVGGPIVDTSGTLLPASTALRDSGVIAFRGGRLQKVNAAGDGWIDVTGHIIAADEPDAGLFEGMVWYDTTNNRLKAYNGIGFEDIGTGGLSDYTGIASYLTASQTLRLIVGGTPDIGAGAGVYAATPSNLDNSENNLTVSYGGVDYEVYDVTLTRVRPADLNALQVYEFRRFNVSVNPALVIMRPLSLDQIVPLQSRTVNLTNAQLKTLDDTYVEIIPTPGAGRYIDIQRFSLTVTGTDQFPAVDRDTNRAIYNLVIFAYFALLFEIDTSNGYPLFQGEYSAIDFETFQDLFFDPITLKYTTGGQRLLENKPLVFGFIQGADVSFRTRMDGGELYYSAAAYDAYWTGVDDKALAIEVDYYIHD